MCDFFYLAEISAGSSGMLGGGLRGIWEVFVVAP